MRKRHHRSSAPNTLRTAKEDDALKKGFTPSDPTEAFLRPNERKRELQIDGSIGVILALFPFGWQMLQLPNAPFAGLVSWSICLAFIGRVIWITTYSRLSRKWCNALSALVPVLLVSLLWPTVDHQYHARKLHPPLLSTTISQTETAPVQKEMVPPTISVTGREPKLELQQFTINSSDSLYEKCPSDRCVASYWPDNVPMFQPTPEAARAFDCLDKTREAGASQLFGEPGRSYDVPSDVAAFAKRFRSHRRFYMARLLPVFDVVVANSGQQTAALTEIEVIEMRNDVIGAGGAGEDRPEISHIIPVLHRYKITLHHRDVYDNDDNYIGPKSRFVPATPPIAVAPNDPARFQISFDSHTGRFWWFELRLRFHFGEKISLTTKIFGVTM